jgi:SAM-dependent methyltransferase
MERGVHFRSCEERMKMHIRAMNLRGQPLYLNVASSTNVMPGFVNLDNSPLLVFARFASWLMPLLRADRRRLVQRYRAALSAGSLVLHDCRRPLHFENGCVDHLLCSHFLEHVYPDEARDILADFLRVLKPGGTAHFVLPDLEVAVRGYLSSGSADRLMEELGLTQAKTPSRTRRLLEALGWEGLQHRWMYDRGSFSVMVKDVGFDLVDRPERCASEEWRRDDPGSFHVFARKGSSPLGATVG